MKRLFLWTTAFAIASFAVACDRATGSTSGATPTGPSGTSSGTGNASASDVARVASACGMSVGQDGVIGHNPGGPGAGNGGDPGGTSTSGPGDGGPSLTPGPAPAGAQTVLVGQVGRVAGSCPALTVTLQGATVWTSAATSFPSSCGSIKSNDRIGVVGTTQADGAVAASCVSAF